MRDNLFVSNQLQIFSHCLCVCVKFNTFSPTHARLHKLMTPVLFMSLQSMWLHLFSYKKCFSLMFTSVLAKTILHLRQKSSRNSLNLSIWFLLLFNTTSIFYIYSKIQLSNLGFFCLLGAVLVFCSCLI